MGRQFGRQLSVVVSGSGGGLDVSGLRIKFEVTKNIMGAPDTCKLEIYNLTKDNQEKVKKEFDQVTVNAGYESDTGLLFNGQIRNVFRKRDGVDLITEIWAGDADQSYKRATSNFTLADDTKVKDIITKVIGDMPKVNEGTIDIEEGIKKLKGISYSGSCRDILTQLGKDYNFNWSIQNSFLNCIDAGKTLPKEVIKINSKSGMIGAPIITARGASVSILLNWKAEPHALINIESETNAVQFGNLFFTDIPETLGKGEYKIGAVTHIGDTHGTPWYSNIEGLNIT